MEFRPSLSISSISQSTTLLLFNLILADIERVYYGLPKTKTYLCDSPVSSDTSVNESALSDLNYCSHQLYSTYLDELITLRLFGAIEAFKRSLMSRRCSVLWPTSLLFSVTDS